MGHTRRSVLAGVLGGAFLVGSGAGLAGCASVDTVGQVDFGRPLAIPPLADAKVDRDGRRVFDLVARAGTHDIGGESVRSWGFNGNHLGPTLRARRGERVVVNVVNEVDEETTVHWHGMHLPARMDGGPHQPIRPGATWSPTWTVEQPAATLWYHPHPHGETRHHVTRGLAGMFILDEDDEAQRALPREYGVDDIPIIVQDKDIHKGQFRERTTGTTLLVNGTLGPYLDVTTEKVRLRLLNASVARTYAFGFADRRTFAMVASDGGLLAAPAPMTAVRLSPGERAEIVVDMRPGETVVLRSDPPKTGGVPFIGGQFGGRDRFDVLELRAAPQLRPSTALPARFRPIERLDPADAVTTRDLRLSGTNINDRDMDMQRIDAVVTKGTTEIWDVENQDGQPHSFHVHDVQFQLLSYDTLSHDGAAPPVELAGWKDTVFLPPNARARLIMKFTDYADPEMPYMFHCHLLMHEDKGMMGQFVVVEPGQRPGRIHAAHEHG